MSFHVQEKKCLFRDGVFLNKDEVCVRYKKNNCDFFLSGGGGGGGGGILNKTKISFYID